MQNLVKLKERLNFDVLYVDNSSSDNSVNKAKAFRNTLNLTIIKNKKNLGYT